LSSLAMGLQAAHQMSGLGKVTIEPGRIET